jgi:hypothetical protein
MRRYPTSTSRSRVGITLQGPQSGPLPSLETSFRPASKTQSPRPKISDAPLPLFVKCGLLSRRCVNACVRGGGARPARFPWSHLVGPPVRHWHTVAALGAVSADGDDQALRAADAPDVDLDLWCLSVAS